MALRNTALCDVFMLILFGILACRGDEYKSLPTNHVLELQMEHEANLETKTRVMTDTGKKLHGGGTVVRWNPATNRSLTDSRIDPLDHSKKEISKQSLAKHHRTPGLHAAGPPHNVPDSNTLPLDRKRRYAIARSAHGGKWLKTDLTYYIQHFTSQLSRKLTRLAIRTAFDAWQRDTALQFTEVFDNEANITLLFTSGNHGDGQPFHPQLIAHAYSPAYGGDVHFNDDVKWTVGANGMYDLAIIAAHEIGHSLGLGHSSDKNAIMFYDLQHLAFYTMYPPHLGQDDIDGIQALYMNGEPLADDKQTRKRQRSLRHHPNNSTDHLQDESIPISPVPSGTSIYLQMPEIQNRRLGSLPHPPRGHPYIPENNRSGNQRFQRTTSGVTDATYEQLNLDQVSGLGSYWELPDNISYELCHDYAITQEGVSTDEKFERSDSNRTYEVSRSPRGTLRGGAESDGYIQVLEEEESDEVPEQ